MNDLKEITIRISTYEGSYFIFIGKHEEGKERRRKLVVTQEFDDLIDELCTAAHTLNPEEEAEAE